MFEGTIAENIAYSRPDATQTEIAAAAEAANCMDFIGSLPQGFDTNAKQLSGGQRQRISIARSLLRGAPILLMDEATSALDTNSEHLINRTIQKIVNSGQATVWVIAHRLSTIKSADVIVLLDQGRVAEVGTFDELNVPGTKFEKLVRAQLTDTDKSSSKAIDGEASGDFEGTEEGKRILPQGVFESGRLEAAEEARRHHDRTAVDLANVMARLPEVSNQTLPSEDEVEMLAASQYADRLAQEEGRS